MILATDSVGFPGSAIINWNPDSELKSSQNWHYRSPSLAQAHGYCKTDIPSHVNAWKSNPTGERVMADSMEHI